MIVDVIGTQANYRRHLDPIVTELRRRGQAVVTGQRSAPALLRGEIAVVASWIDARRLDGRRVVYVEHGAGQTYVGRPHGYAGAPGLDHVELFCCPNDTVAARWREHYPAARVEVVGCPALDRYQETRFQIPGRPLVAITAHWRCRMCPETMPATPRFERVIGDLARSGAVEIVGHAHPRGVLEMEPLWRRLAIPYEPDPDVVLNDLARSGQPLLVADNTSLMYEAAALGIPVLALNSPRYRRDVEHGLRFWSHVPGLQCDEISDFVAMVHTALTDPPEARELRARAAAVTYGAVDGSATVRAVDAIEELTR